MAVGWDDAAYQAAVRAVEGLPPVPAHALERIRPVIGPALRAAMADVPTDAPSVVLPDAARRRVANLAQKIRGRSGAFKEGGGRYEAATRTVDGQIRLYARWVSDAPEDASPVFSAA